MGYDEGVEPSEPTVYSGIAKLKRRELAGHACFERYEKLRSAVQADASSDNDDDSSPQSAQHFRDKKREREAKREKERAMNDGGLLKISEALKDVDLYKLLEVSLGSSL